MLFLLFQLLFLFRFGLVLELCTRILCLIEGWNYNENYDLRSTNMKPTSWTSWQRNLKTL